MSTMSSNGNTAPQANESGMMTLRERDAVIALCLMAALADGKTDDGERERLRQIATELTGDASAADTIFQRVQLYQTTMQNEAGEIEWPELRERTFEMCVGLVNADGVVTKSESAFLDALAASLKVDPRLATSVINTTDTLAAGSLENEPAFVPPPLPVVAAAAGAAAASALGMGPSIVTGGKGFARPEGAAGAGGAPSGPVTAEDAEIDSSIQTYSIVAGALELLPQSLASMAIIPLQMKMVYGVGKRYGYTLDSGHIKDLLATVGVGVTSQVFEGYARRLVGGLLGKAAGGLLGKSAGKWAGSIGQGATGAAVTFGTTYALGKVAKQYYAGGRKFSAIDLQSLFTRELSSAKGVYEKVAPQIQAQARTLNPANVMKLVRGG